MSYTPNMQEAARRYAAADPSDPFALNRALLHLRNGVASYANHNGQGAFYDAEAATELRMLPDGTEYVAQVYRNRVRP